MTRIKNLTKVINNIKKFGKEAVEVLDIEISGNVNDIILDAAQRVMSASGNNDGKARSTDLGALSKSISKAKLKDLNYLIYVGGAAIKYAPYVEFGTGNRVSLTYLKDIGLPDSYAAKFKGKGIKQVNLPARPYFFPAIIDGRKDLEKRLNAQLKKLTQKANG